jgi:hypothetical protein
MINKPLFILMLLCGIAFCQTPTVVFTRPVCSYADSSIIVYPVVCYHEEWVDTQYKYQTNWNDSTIRQETFGSIEWVDSVTFKYIPPVDERKYAPIQYCKKCGIFRLNLNEIKETDNAIQTHE